MFKRTHEPFISAIGLATVLNVYKGRLMSAYNLLDGQKERLRKFVDAYQKTGVSNFHYVFTMNSQRVFFDKPGVGRIVIEADSNDLRVLESEGLVQLRYGGDGKLAGGSIRQSAVEAVTNHFERPMSTEGRGAVYQTFYAPVGAVNTGEGKIEIGTQHVGMGSEEIASLFAKLRELIPLLPFESQTEAIENLNDLQSELGAQVPKQNRIKAFLLSLWTAGNGVVAFAASLAALAQAYGIHLPV